MVIGMDEDTCGPEKRTDVNVLLGETPVRVAE
jgi:hypothetical protein